jgi:hypothetical protein
MKEAKKMGLKEEVPGKSVIEKKLLAGSSTMIFCVLLNKTDNYGW